MREVRKIIQPVLLPYTQPNISHFLKDFSELQWIYTVSHIIKPFPQIFRKKRFIKTFALLIYKIFSIICINYSRLHAILPMLQVLWILLNFPRYHIISKVSETPRNIVTKNYNYKMHTTLTNTKCFKNWKLCHYNDEKL